MRNGDLVSQCTESDGLRFLANRMRCRLHLLRNGHDGFEEKLELP
jgi:hypothetical protein